MADTNRMMCPDCGTEMNHHANKLVYVGADEAPDGADKSGGLVIEAHTCPDCGRTETRGAAP